jgi:hypothetical protein
VKVVVSYLQKCPKTGVLRYRRVFPQALRPFIRDGGKPLTELKVSIGARSINEPGAKARHDAVAAKYDAMVARARKLAAGLYDPLPSHVIDYLAGEFLHKQAAMDAAARMGLPPPEFPFETRIDREEDYEQSRAMLDAYDGAGLVEYWRDYAAAFSLALGYSFDTASPAFAALCHALGEAACKLWLTVDQRNDGQFVDTPPAPSAPEAAPLATETAILSPPKRAVPGGSGRSAVVRCRRRLPHSEHLSIKQKRRGQGKGPFGC